MTSIKHTSHLEGILKQFSEVKVFFTALVINYKCIMGEIICVDQVFSTILKCIVYDSLGNTSTTKKQKAVSSY